MVTKRQFAEEQKSLFWKSGMKKPRKKEELRFGGEIKTEKEARGFLKKGEAEMHKIMRDFNRMFDNLLGRPKMKQLGTIEALNGMGYLAEEKKKKGVR